MDPKLYQAVIKGDIASMKELASSDSTVLFQVTQKEDNILHVAAKYDANQIAQEIVKLPRSGQLVDQNNSKGDTPLHVAAKMGSFKTSQVLVNVAKSTSGEIEAGEKMIRMVNSHKDTALHDAVRNGYNQIVELLIGEDPGLTLLTNDAGESPLFIAVDKRHVEIAQHILDVAADFSIEGRNNMNVLHVAVIRSKHEVITFVDYLWEIVTSRRVLTESSIKYGLKAVSVLVCGIRKVWGASNNLDYKNGRKRRPAETRKIDQTTQPETKFEPAIDAEVVGGDGLKYLNYNQLKEIGNTNALVATLVGTVSFAAGITMPGGNKSDGPDEGMPNLGGLSAFRVSVMANVIAFALSTLSMAFHYYSSYMEKLNRLALYTNLSTMLLINAIVAMGMSFSSGTYAVLSPTSGLANAVLAIAGCTVFVFISVVLKY